MKAFVKILHNTDNLQSYDQKLCTYIIICVYILCNASMHVPDALTGETVLAVGRGKLFTILFSREKSFIQYGEVINIL